VFALHEILQGLPFFADGSFAQSFVSPIYSVCCEGLTTLPPSFVLKTGSLNLLEPSRPVQACNGSALPLPYLVYIAFFQPEYRGTVFSRNVCKHLPDYTMSQPTGPQYDRDSFCISVQCKAHLYSKVIISRVSSVGVVTRLRTGRPTNFVSNPGRGRRFYLP
jgi:hypothetical protein